MQKIFSLPDMSHMQVKVNTHESLVKKIKVGQPAEIRIDAFANAVFTGEVKSVFEPGRLVAALDQRRRQGVSHDREHQRS